MPADLPRDTPVTPATSDTNGQQERICQLAAAVDCMSEEDLCLLAGITPKTAETWRKRGRGPDYVLIGNRYLYPRQAVADFVAANRRERRQVPAKAVL